MKNTILNDLRKVVTLESISKLAFKHKFSKRSTCQIKGIDFLQILILGVSSGLEITYSSLNASLREIKPQLALSNQAIAKYFYKASSVDFIRSVYEKIFSFQKSAILLSKVPKVHFKPNLSPTSLIRLQETVEIARITTKPKVFLWRVVKLARSTVSYGRIKSSL